MNKKEKRNAVSALKKISDNYRITGTDKENLDAIEEWCDDKKYFPSNGNLFHKLNIILL